jgi:hypothetical protein
MEHPKFVGDRTALAVMLALHEMRIPFLVPLGENTQNNQRRRIRFGAVYEIAKVSVMPS